MFREWKNWVDWSNSKQGVITYPADPFYRIRWSDHVMGFNSPTDNPFVQLAFEGC